MEEKIYEYLWRNKWLTAKARSIREMVENLRRAASELEAMQKAGIVLDPEGGTADDYARLITMDPEVARQFGLNDETEEG